MNKANCLSSIVILIATTMSGCSSDYTENLGNGYYFKHEGGPLNEIYSEKRSGGRIPATVLDYEYNAEYIIAKQKPNLPQSILYDKKYVYTYGPEEFYYWLIIKSDHIVLGPLNLLEFSEAKRQYNVPNSLNLK